MLNDIWIPDLEIYGLEEYNSAAVIRPMAGVRVLKQRSIEFNARQVTFLTNIA